MFFVLYHRRVSSISAKPPLSATQLYYESGAMKESHVLTFPEQKYKEYSFLAITRP